MKILFFAGSLRKDSYNKKFVREAQRAASAIKGIETDFLDLKDFPMPPYDGDIEDGPGIPEATKKLGARIMAADALVIATPEYNGSIPGTLKNVIDWLSREDTVSLENKPLLLLAASPGALGGVRVLWQARVPFEVIGTHVFPGMMGLPGAAAAFDDQGHLKDEKTAKRLNDLINQFVEYHRT